MMLSILASLVFAVAACFAVAAILVSWRAYGPAMLGLRDELARCETTRELRYTVLTTQVRCADGAVQFRPVTRQSRLASLSRRRSGLPLRAAA